MGVLREVGRKSGEEEQERERERSFNLHSGCQGGRDYSTVQGFSTTCRNALTARDHNAFPYLSTCMIYIGIYMHSPSRDLRYTPSPNSPIRLQIRGEIYIGIYICIYIYTLLPEIFDTHPLQILRFVCKDRGEIIMVSRVKEMHEQKEKN